MFGFSSKRRESPQPRFEAASLSETGLVRPENEDNFLADVPHLAFAVADGMGGGAEGARASAIVCRCLREALADAGMDRARRRLAAEGALAAANAEIFAYAKEKGYRQMGSTIAALLPDPCDATRAEVCHIGDSRVYRIRRGMAEALTRDHTIGFELGDFAGSRAADFRSRQNPLAHVLTRAIGVLPRVEADWQQIDLRAGDRFVICSDGVHDVITDARLAVFAAGGTLDSALKRLSDEVIRQGAPDNYTIILTARLPVET